jgi:hypothetical protein
MSIPMTEIDEIPDAAIGGEAALGIGRPDDQVPVRGPESLHGAITDGFLIRLSRFFSRMVV